MYDGFNDTGKHSIEWVRITREFLKLAFTGGRREASCPCNRCENRRMLLEYEMSAQLAKKGFMSSYLLGHQHGEVRPVVADESDGNDDVDRMDDMIAILSGDTTWNLKIHHRRCRIFIGSLPTQKKKCMTVL
jgi:hypothetical protein